MNINKFIYAINNSYNSDTCQPSLQEKWDVNNGALGHCALVALKFFEVYGGEIIRVNIKDYNVKHYYNYFNNQVFDLTRSQFKDNEVYLNKTLKIKEDILSDADFKKRYELFSHRFDKFIETLDTIDKRVLSCKKCSNKVEKFNHHTTISYGKDNSILVIGEAPANNGWRKSGKCWYKEDSSITGSGKIMTKLLSIIDYSLEDISFLEAVKCYPLKRSDLGFCKDNCYPYLVSQITALKPKVIITLGDVATKSLLKNLKYNSFSEVVGKIHTIKLEDIEYNVIPIYHPSPISPLSYKGNEPIFNKIKDLTLIS